MTSPSRADATRDDVRRDVERALAHSRERTLRLLAPLSHDDVHRQVHDYLSPVVWDVGHIGNFEELWLLRNLDGRPAHDEALDHLYNAFENPRWTRGELPLMDANRALPYLADVRSDVLALLEDLDLHPEADGLAADGLVHRMIAQHESQHQETILQALDLRVGANAWDLTPSRGRAREVDDLDRVLVPAGTFRRGTDDRRWTYDNERPARDVAVGAFWIDRFPVTNRRWLAFVEDGGPDRPELWSVRGWQWRQEAEADLPQGWTPTDSGWRVRRFGRLVELDPREPVQHVSFFEAEAFAAWSGGRLPTEVEWEKAAAWDPVAGRSRRFPWGDQEPTADLANVGVQRFGPMPVGAYPAGASALGVEQLAGDVYEWTTSSFEGWEGFLAHPYPEYSEVFFGGDYRVLRGSSWAIAPTMARCTYRNWDHPYRRQIFAGLRLAWDLPQGSR